MAWQAEVGSGTDRATGYRDLLTKIAAMATSQHVATVAINAAGTGYVAGEVLTLTHAGAYLDAKFEILTVGGSGEVTSLRKISNGAFSNRVTSAVVGAAAGSGYAVGDILEIQGGTTTEKAKVRVETLSGSAVATVSVYETGGAYTSAPSSDSATVGVGPSTFAGNNAALITPTMTGLIGTTGLSVTGGSGSGATVDITLADAKAESQRNANSRLVNSVDFEKQVTLVFAAAGSTNKPVVHFRTRTDTSGINTRYSIGVLGSVAHNPSLSIDSQPGLSTEVFLPCDENDAQDMDFWISCDDRRIFVQTNINPGAAQTDDSEYLHLYAGFYDPMAAESEDPYPLLIGASARISNLDPSAASQSITSISECTGPTGSNTGFWFYRSDDASWQNIENSENLNTNQTRVSIMFPMGQNGDITTGSTSDINFADGPVPLWTGIGSTGRASSTRRLLPTPGTTPQHQLIPLTLLHRPGNDSVNQTLDTVRGQPRGIYWLYNSNDAAATIANWAENYIEIGSDRYRIFRNHIHVAEYQFFCVLEDV